MELSKKNIKRRDFIVNGNLWKVILTLSAPLAAFAIFNYIGDIFDIYFASKIGTSEIASVIFIDQIRASISAFGTGIAAAGIVIVGRYYGANEMEEAKKNVSTAFTLTILVAISLMIIFIILGKPLLILLNAPHEIIDNSMGYFNVQIITTSFICINSVFFGLEKAKGNTPRVFLINTLGITIRLTFVSIFILVFKKGFIYIALGNLIAQGLISLIGIYIMLNKKNPFQIKFRNIKLKKEVVLPILVLATPIFLGSMLFNVGKIIVNSMAAFYGTAAIAALGVSLKIVSGGAQLASTFEEVESLVISQNIGGKQIKRAIKSHFIALIYGAIIGVSVVLIITIFRYELVSLFSNTDDQNYFKMVINIIKWEKYSALTSALIAIFAGLFNGFKNTKFTFLLNIFRLYIFRIPALIIFKALKIGYESLGYAMFISNTGTALIGLTISLVLINKIKNYDLNIIK